MPAILTREPYRPGLKFYLSQIYNLLRLEISNVRNREPVLVYQMGKVGSSAVAESLKIALPGTSVFHVHYISESGMDFYKRVTLTPHRDHFGSEYWSGSYLRRRIRKKDRTWNVVTLVRDPIARNVSAFFHDIRNWISDYDQQEYSKPESVARIETVFLEKFPSEIPLDWLDTELEPVLGIDVFATPFPKQIGYQIYQGKAANLLLIRLEDLDRVATEAFGRFLGIAGFTLVRANIAEQREYADIYRRFLKQISLPETYVQRMYRSKLARHFYTERELDGFQAKWLKGTA